MHISSLPGKYGIGGLGKSARKFADKLCEMGISAWQVLPVGPVDFFNSPYASLSAFAGNPCFIDPELLFEDGLLTSDELRSCETDSPYAADFAAVHEKLFPTLRKAFARSEKYRDEIEKFGAENPRLAEYALFCALKDKFDQKPWQEWDEDIRMRKKSALDKAQKELKDEIDFYTFIQYEFYKQWFALKEYANKKGVSIIGDMPIYLNPDSADVWANPELFDLDEKLGLRCCAGVPPDYFCEEGQKWGNPLYNWKAMKKDGYSWWVSRIKNSLALYDALRIDHFRGFSSYWEVPVDKSAKYGKWVKGPGAELFRAVNKACPNAAIIAEDLGEIDDGVIELVKETGYPGMGVMQFAFISPDDNTHLPHNYTKNTVAYTGTHDNNTILGWLWESDEGSRKYALDYCNFSGDWGHGGADSPVIRSILRTLWQSAAILTIVPVQDLVGFGGDTRMNKPGVAEGNWNFRITQEALDSINTDFIRSLTGLYRRNNPLLRED